MPANQAGMMVSPAGLEERVNFERASFTDDRAGVLQDRQRLPSVFASGLWLRPARVQLPTTWPRSKPVGAARFKI
jgi:hypothetical protein